MSVQRRKLEPASGVKLATVRVSTRRIASAFVLADFRVSAEILSSSNTAIDNGGHIAVQLVDARSGQGFRGRTILDPRTKGQEWIDGDRANTTSAVPDTRRIKLSVEALNVWNDVLDPIVVVDRALREDELIGQSMPGNHFAAVVSESAQIWTGGASDGVVLEFTLRTDICGSEVSHWVLGVDAVDTYLGSYHSRGS